MHYFRNTPQRNSFSPTNFYNQSYKPFLNKILSNVTSGKKRFSFRFSLQSKFFGELLKFFLGIRISRSQMCLQEWSHQQWENNLHVIITEHSRFGIFSLPCLRAADAGLMVITTTMEKALFYVLLRFCLIGLRVQENGHSYVLSVWRQKSETSGLTVFTVLWSKIKIGMKWLWKIVS